MSIVVSKRCDAYIDYIRNSLTSSPFTVEFRNEFLEYEQWTNFVSELEADGKTLSIETEEFDEWESPPKTYLTITW